MAILSNVSGVNGKLPAAFVADLGHMRLLMDLGEGPEPGVRPDASKLGQIDAIFLSHAHVDHVGAMDLWQSLGRPPVFASAATFRGLPHQGIDLPSEACHILPLSGPARIMGLDVLVGRSGHAMGGLWLYIAQCDLLYMGDWSRESCVLQFDMPPPAKTMITDISYCDRSTTLALQLTDLVANTPNGAVLPVPPLARGTELAWRLHEAGREVAVCEVVHSEITALAEDCEGHLSAEAQTSLRALLPKLCLAQDASAESLIVAVEADHASSIVHELAQSTDRPFVLTGHVAPNSFGANLIRAGRADRSPWNVHPALGCNLWLAENLNPSVIVPAFGPLSEAPQFAQALARKITINSEVSL